MIMLVLRYAAHFFEDPAAVARVVQWASAPSKPPKFAPSPELTLLKKKDIFAVSVADCALTPAALPQIVNAKAERKVVCFIILNIL